MTRIGVPAGETESALSCEVRERLVLLIQPLHQDLDGLSHYEEIGRTSALARRFYRSTTPEEDRHFELILLFQRLGPWLLKVGNLSRTLLVSRPDVNEMDLRRVSQSLARLDGPKSEAERALSTAMLIESCGARALVERFTRARREGLTARGVAEEILSASAPDRPWLVEEARTLIRRRFEKQQDFCRELIAEV